MSFPPVPATPSTFMANLSLADFVTPLVKDSRKIAATAEPQLASQRARGILTTQPLPTVLELPLSQPNEAFVMHQSPFYVPLREESNVSHVYSRDRTAQAGEERENGSPTKMSLSVTHTGKKIRSLAFN